MSWLLKSLTDDQDSEDGSPKNRTGGSGVKEDLSVIGDSIGRQFRNVANFMAPPPTTSTTTDIDESQPTDSSQSQQALQGIKNDLAEIGGSLKTGFSKFTSNFLPFKNQDSDQEDDDDEEEEVEDDVAGVTNEVIDFVKEISLRPQCWTDFPLPLPNDFRMSDVQRQHALTIEYFVHTLRDLRASLQSDIGDGQFWMIYFILLLPRLNERDIEILLTPQIVETRNKLLPMLQNKRNAKVGISGSSDTHTASQEGSKFSERPEENISSQDTEVSEIVKATRRLEIDVEDNAEQWLKETDVDTDTTLDGRNKVEHEEDVSFSDLEEDNDLLSRQFDSGKPRVARTPSPSSSVDWVQLDEGSVSQGGQQKARHSISREKDSDGDSNDWLKVDDDFD